MRGPEIERLTRPRELWMDFVSPPENKKFSDAAEKRKREHEIRERIREICWIYRRVKISEIYAAEDPRAQNLADIIATTQVPALGVAVFDHRTLLPPIPILTLKNPLDRRGQGLDFSEIVQRGWNLRAAGSLGRQVVIAPLAYLNRLIGDAEECRITSVAYG